MKKIWAMILTAALFLPCLTALAEPGRIDDSLFDTAKQALRCMDTGDFQRASALLGCADEDELRQLAEGEFSTLGDGSAQTRISVAFVSGGAWYLAVPTREPSSSDVDALLLDCGSGNGFSGASRASWGSVEKKLDKSDWVIWNEEYAEDVVVIDD